MITVNINARDHEQAHVASAKLTLAAPAGGLEVLQARLMEQLRITVLWAEETQRLVGHVKAYLQWGQGEAVMLSTTGGPVEAKGSPLPEAVPEAVELGVTAIVFGGELEAVEDRLEGLAAAMVGQYGDWCTYIHECEHHHDHDGHDHHDHHDHEDHGHHGHSHGE